MDVVESSFVGISADEPIRATKEGGKKGGNNHTSRPL
jgi:hypothetical protein